MEQKNNEDIEKIKEGLRLAYRRMIEFKKYKKTPVVVMKGEDIVEINPEDIDLNVKIYQ